MASNDQHATAQAETSAEPVLCANSCGFYGNPVTSNMCSKCYKDVHSNKALSQPPACKCISTAAVIDKPTPPSSVLAPPAWRAALVLNLRALPPLPATRRRTMLAPRGEGRARGGRARGAGGGGGGVCVRAGGQPGSGGATPAGGPFALLLLQQEDRIDRVQVPLRLLLLQRPPVPDQHACPFDYKQMGREQVAKANPLVQAQKLEKI
eukprot:CAMPEP_0179882436 /NCGR_PEP_ID=MMETSP0982-20121206/28149_1 /TAXON_ID=483367 /ORGANISM="non described non described, Strain CCMP 2436" /LENGTH=207 /DNA_ID=CAMNT_0021776755 /DNA_START=65 /DNA_END=690 /DNA_ORIENTATION=+